jgi:hypothetical protein
LINTFVCLEKRHLSWPYRGAVYRIRGLRPKRGGAAERAFLAYEDSVKATHDGVNWSLRRGRRSANGFGEATTRADAAE